MALKKTKVTLNFTGDDYDQIVAQILLWIHGYTGSPIPGNIPGTQTAQSSTSLKTFEDWVRKSISDFSVSAQNTAKNEKLLETSMNQLADQTETIKQHFDSLDAQIKNIPTDMDAKIKTLTNSQQAQINAMTKDQKAAMAALLAKFQEDLQSTKDEIDPRISALEALHKGVMPKIHKITKPIINKGTPLYNFDMRLDVNGTHIVRTVIPFMTTYYVIYYKNGQKFSMRSTQNEDLRFFNEDGYLAFEPKAFPNDLSTLEIWPSTYAPLPTVNP